ncbi:hypothetical protein [Streptomyces sp. NPDC046805]|uniref:hypothetical protein n=1 Tax=Streptomyces sp. NPDC046805 TaxID=3155134 RepID=UPI0033FD020E
MVGRIAWWGAALGLGVAWWWAALRITLGTDTGLVEGVVVAGGWGLSLLPVHCVPKKRAAGAVGAGRWAAAWRAGTPGGAAGSAGTAGGAGEVVSRLRRRGSDAGSGSA